MGGPIWMGGRSHWFRWSGELGTRGKAGLGTRYHLMLEKIGLLFF